jgi:hypothetical protein
MTDETRPALTVGTLFPEGKPNERQGDYLRTRAYLWSCGDDECDCYQPVVERLYRNRLSSLAGAVWSVRVWEGSFHSQPDADEMATMRAELAAAIEYFRLGEPPHV